jgi:hypothetical protein
MSTNLATILVGLGYDLSALEKGAPEAFQLINRQTLGMSAEMKRTSREGAESMRLIGESIHLHISRPVARILSQEFPALAQAMSTLLGAGVFGVLAVAGVEFFDKVARGIEKAQRAQEAFKESTLKVTQTFDDALASYEKSAKLRSLDGLDKKLFELDASGVEEARKKIDQLTEAMAKSAKAAADAGHWYTRLFAAIGDIAHESFSFASTLNIEKIDAQLGKFKEKFDELSATDALKQTHDSAKLLNDELEAAKRKLSEMTAQAALAPKLLFAAPGAAPQFAATISQKELDAQRSYISGLEKINQIEHAAAADTTAKENEAKQADMLERERSAAQALATLYKDMGESIKKLMPEADPLKKLEEEIRLLKQQAEIQFAEVGRSATSALAMRTALAGLEEYEKKLDAVMSKARREDDVVKATAKLPQSIPASSAAPFPDFSRQQPLPQLGAGGAAAAQFDVFQKDAVEQLKLAAQAYQDIESPQQKYDLGLQELSLLLKKGLIDNTAFTAAVSRLDEELVRSEDHLHKLETQLQKVLERSKNATDGVKAFFLQLQIEASSDARFTFEILSKGLQGVEDETVKALTGAKTSWQQFFYSLDQMALKFLLNKGISQLLQMMSGTDFGKSLGLDKLLGGGQDQAAAKQAVAATTMLTAAGMQMSAANIMAASGAAGGAAGSGGAGILSGFIPGFASGTDYAPGGAAWVGENGPELLNLPMGSSVTPNSSLRGSGTTHNHFYDNRGADMAAIQRLERMLPLIEERAVARSVASVSEINQRTAH